MLTQEEVQQKLKQIGFYKEFTVEFVKKDGTKRVLRGFMEPPVNGKPKSPSAVAVKEINSGVWKSFKIDSVSNLTITSPR